MANLPVLTLLEIHNTESQFAIAYANEHRDLDQQTMLYQLIDFTFNEKVMWLADRPEIFEQAKERNKTRFDRFR